MDKVWVIENPDEYLKPRRAARIPEIKFPVEKDPARAYTLSLLFWGSGQLYNGQRTKGLDYAGLALYGAAFALLLLIFRRELPFYLHFFSISPAQAVLVAALLLFFFLIFWIFNASDAYHIAIKARRTPFTGVKSRAWPVFCSLLVPGWGQFLNGQPLKGGLFAVCAALAVFSLISVLAILQVWHFLEDSYYRLIVEEVLLLSMMSLLLTPFLWVLGAFDAWKVGQDDIKKEPFLERLKAANNRRRAYGWVPGVFPQIKTTLLLVLLLSILVITAARFYFPWDYYHHCLMQALSWSSQQGMMLVSEFIRGVIAILPVNQF